MKVKLNKEWKPIYIISDEGWDDIIELTQDEVDWCQDSLRQFILTQQLLASKWHVR